MTSGYHRNKQGKIGVCKVKPESGRRCIFEALDASDPALVEYLESKQKSATGVNVSEFETKFVNAFVEYVNTGVLNPEELLELPVQNRPTLFRNMTTAEEIKQSMVSLKQAIQTKLNVEELNLVAVRDNRKGSDLVETITGEHVELKLGEATAGNVGFDNISQVIPTSLLSKLPTRQHRDLWRKMYASDPAKAKQQIASNHSVLLKSFAEEANKTLTVGQESNQALNRYYQGFNLGQDENEKLSIFYYKTGGVWEESSRPYVANEDWTFDEATFVDSTGRLTLWFRNKTLKTRWKAVYNYKNNYILKHADGTEEKVAAKIGLGTPSFNCWFFPLVEKTNN